MLNSDFVAKINLGVDPNLTHNRVRKQKYYSPSLRNCFDWSDLQVRQGTSSQYQYCYLDLVI